ncbi:MAG: DUF3795 domain-containing protein, partial [Eubacteriales bacterium]|nr:DUF3795 domain-containing protein [Eubacteriales bacterium]
MIDTYCGLCCEGCAFQNEPYHCGGCIKTQGNPFHGACPVAACCREKGCVHCGECADFPCPLLHDYSYDAQHGDDGARIKQCAAWAGSREKSRYPQIYAYLMSKPVTAWDFKVEWQWQRFHVDGKHFAV